MIIKALTVLLVLIGVGTALFILEFPTTDDKDITPYQTEQEYVEMLDLFYDLDDPSKVYTRDEEGKFIEVKDYGKR